MGALCCSLSLLISPQRKKVTHVAITPSVWVTGQQIGDTNPIPSDSLEKNCTANPQDHL